LVRAPLRPLRALRQPWGLLRALRAIALRDVVAARAAPPALAEALAELLADARALRRRKAHRRIKPTAHAIDAVLAHPRERLCALPRLDVVVVKR
jgi:hypothetical protein